MHLADSRPNSKRIGGLLEGWTHQGPLESGRKPYQPPAHGRNLISLCAPQVLGGTGDRDFRPQVQSAPTYYIHEGGGPL